MLNDIDVSLEHNRQSQHQGRDRSSQAVHAPEASSPPSALKYDRPNGDISHIGGIAP